MERVLICGAGGFIGGWLTTYMKNKGYFVRGADIKFPEFSLLDPDEFYKVDLRDMSNCLEVTKDVDWVFQLAADMGGIGYITSNHADIMRNNLLINSNMLEASRINGVKKFLFSSSACVYPQHLQRSEDVVPLKESDAYPADAEPGYGWEKLMTELLCKYYREDHSLQTYIVRFHNVGGMYGTFDGGKEKAPAAICRKVAKANNGDSIDIWGDGKQTRSYMYVGDCVEGLYRLINSDFHDPLNLGTDRLVSVDELVDIICSIAGKKLNKVHDTSKPQGVRGRNSDNALCRQVLGWEPSTSLETWLKETYKWIEWMVKNPGEIYRGSKQDPKE